MCEKKFVIYRASIYRYLPCTATNFSKQTLRKNGLGLLNTLSVFTYLCPSPTPFTDDYHIISQAKLSLDALPRSGLTNLHSYCNQCISYVFVLYYQSLIS